MEDSSGPLNSYHASHEMESMANLCHHLDPTMHRHSYGNDNRIQAGFACQPFQYLSYIHTLYTTTYNITRIMPQTKDKMTPSPLVTKISVLVCTLCIGYE
jgi:hypothetical protein